MADEREQDHHVIREAGPVPEIQPGSPRDPVAILPEEIWVGLLPYLNQDHWDVHHLAATCPQMEQLLHVVPEVASCRLSLVIPFILQWLSLTAILNCRRICKRITSIVDNTLMISRTCLPSTTVFPFPRHIPPKVSVDHFHRQRFSPMGINGPLVNSVRRIERLRQYVETGVISTLVAGSLNLSFIWRRRTLPQMENYLERVQRLLQTDTIRNAVRHLVIRNQQHNANLDNRELEYDMVRRCIQALPNLVSLELFEFELPPVLPIPTQVVSHMDDYMLENPLPQSPNLVHLGMDVILRSRMSLFAFVDFGDKYGAQLKSFDINFKGEGPPEHAVEWDDDINFPLLSKLKIKRASWHWRNILIWISAPALERLCLETPFPDAPDPIATLNQLIQFVCLFPSVSVLYIKALQLPKVTVEFFEHSLPVLQAQVHVSLKRLVFQESDSRFSLLLFAALFPNLESITVIGIPWSDIKQGGKLHSDWRLCHERRFQESELWSRLPNLKTFWCNDYVCTRDEAVRSQNNNLGTNDSELAAVPGEVFGMDLTVSLKFFESLQFLFDE